MNYIKKESKEECQQLLEKYNELKKMHQSVSEELESQKRINDAIQRGVCLPVEESQFLEMAYKDGLETIAEEKILNKSLSKDTHIKEDMIHKLNESKKNLIEENNALKKKNKELKKSNKCLKQELDELKDKNSDSKNEEQKNQKSKRKTDRTPLTNKKSKKANKALQNLQISDVACIDSDSDIPPHSQAPLQNLNQSKDLEEEEIPKEETKHNEITKAKKKKTKDKKHKMRKQEKHGQPKE